jgi:hypothetical protein
MCVGEGRERSGGENGRVLERDRILNIQAKS